MDIRYRIRISPIWAIIATGPETPSTLYSALIRTGPKSYRPRLRLLRPNSRAQINTSPATESSLPPGEAKRGRQRESREQTEMAPPLHQRALLLFPLVFLLLLLLAPPRADAWGKEGHIMVCKIAEVAPNSCPPG